MRFGFMMPFQNPPRWARPYPELYREYIDQTVLAEELGYDTIWLTSIISMMMGGRPPCCR